MINYKIVMRKSIIGISILITIMIALFVFLNKGESYIEKQQWKYTEGNYIGDLINFKDDEYIKSKSIYRKDKVIAKIVFCTESTLIIKNPESGKKGYYSKISIGSE